MKKTKRNGSTYACQPTVKPKKRIDILYRIFALKFNNIIPPSGASVKVLREFYEENYEVFVTMEKWKRRLCVLILALCATAFVLCAIAVVDLFMKV